MDIAEKLAAARSAEGERLWDALRLRHPEVMLQATLNRDLTEDMALFIIKSRAAPAEALGHLAGDVRFKGSYKCRLALARNPRTPQRVAVAILKFIKIFDLADISRDRRIPVSLRQKVEQMLSERVAALPSGVKSALSRRASANVILRIMERGDRKAVDACLDSPLLREEDLQRLVLRESTRPSVIAAIAAHPKWSLRYSVRYALIRNFHTPMRHVERSIEGMKAGDLRELYASPGVPSSTKPFIYRELAGRGEPVEGPAEKVYEVMAEAEEDGEFYGP